MQTDNEEVWHAATVAVLNLKWPTNKLESLKVSGTTGIIEYLSLSVWTSLCALSWLHRVEQTVSAKAAHSYKLEGMDYPSRGTTKRYPKSALVTAFGNLAGNGYEK